MATKRFWITLCAVVLALASLVIGIWLLLTSNNEYSLRIALSGMRELTVEFGSDYIEPGATAVFSGTLFHKEGTSVPVTVEGVVDTTKLGSFQIKYTATYKGHVGTSYRRIHVVDTEAPVIKLVKDPDKFTFPGDTYQEEGYSAIDSRDGDLTQQVKRTETREKITYTVTDSSGNTRIAERMIVYDDPISPELKINGNKFISLRQGQTFQDPGFTAWDNCDGDLTSRVVVSGNVNTSAPGVYTLVYTVSDSYDNTVSITRMVSVLKKNAFVNDPAGIVVPDGKIIYLTFDDGPSPHTPKLLDVLKKYDVKATFFVMNTGHTDVIKRIAEEGHSVGIHTTSHNYKKIYASEAAYFNDLYNMQGIIKELTGKETNLLRFPGGSSNTVSRFNRKIMTRLAKQVQERGFRYFDWNVDSNDAGGAKYTSEVYNNVVNGISKKQIAVVLQHDTKEFSVNAVEQIILWGLSNDYTFLPLDASSPICHHSIRN